MQDYRTPLQKKLDAKHKKNMLPSNHYKNKQWSNGFVIQPSNHSDISAVEFERYERIRNYTQGVK